MYDALRGHKCFSIGLNIFAVTSFNKQISPYNWEFGATFCDPQPLLFYNYSIRQ